MYLELRLCRLFDMKYMLFKYYGIEYYIIYVYV